MVLRDARREELDAIAALIRAAYEEYKRFYLPEVWQRYITNVGNIHDRFGECDLIVAERGGVIAGTVSFYADGSRSRQGEWRPGWAGILRLAVPPEQRGAGLGRALIEECLGRCRARGIASVALHTTDWMSTARAMYERMGFVRVPDFDFHPRPGVVGMGYRLDLTARQ